MPVPRMGDRCTAPNVCGIRVRNIKSQTNCLDCEFRKARQDFASIGLLVQPIRAFRRIPLPYGIELLSLSSGPARFSSRTMGSDAAQLRLLQEVFAIHDGNAIH